MSGPGPALRREASGSNSVDTGALSDDIMIRKADQIAYHLFTKLFLVVDQARNTDGQPEGVSIKTDKWVRFYDLFMAAG